MDGKLWQPDMFGAPDTLYGAGGRRKRPSGLEDEIREALKPDMVRVAPGRHAWVPAPHRDGKVPSCVLCRWEKDGGGSWRPVPVGGRFSRVRAELVAAMGFNTGPARQKYETLVRLGRAGFIDMVKLSPGCWFIDMDSWHRHLLRCMENPEMWEEGSEDLETYRFWNGLGRRET